MEDRHRELALAVYQLSDCQLQSNWGESRESGADDFVFLAVNHGQLIRAYGLLQSGRLRVR
jgi:hypothetical protein